LLFSTLRQSFPKKLSKFDLIKSNILTQIQKIIRRSLPLEKVGGLREYKPYTEVAVSVREAL
jgi:hypothetical protein